MTKLLNYIIAVLGGWLIVSPFVLGYSSAIGIGASAIAGVLVVALAVANSRLLLEQRLSLALLGLGVVLILWGIGGAIAGVASGWSEVIAGALVAVAAAVILPFQVAAEKVVSHNRNGGELATFTQIRVKDNNILVKSILLGSMPETIYMRPEELCKMVAVMDPAVIFALPRLLYAGWKSNRATAR